MAKSARESVTGHQEPGRSGGLYFWVTDESRFDHWRKAMRWESSTQMKYLRDLLSAIPWWRLEPAHEWIVQQPDPWTGRRVLARPPEGDTAVLYVPDSASVTVNLSEMKAPLRVRWLNPRTGQTTESERLAQISRPVTLTPPDRGDWALLISAIPARRR